MKIKIEFAKKEVKALQEAGAEYFAREGEWNNTVGIKGNNPAKINKDTLYWENPAMKMAVLKSKSKSTKIGQLKPFVFGRLNSMQS